MNLQDAHKLKKLSLKFKDFLYTILFQNHKSLYKICVTKNI